jgi:RNA polymerase sigma factor (TIGR02999 family)
MATAGPNELTKLLLDWSDGDRTALEKLIPLVYDELRQLARRQLKRERQGHTLQTTALVNEVYLRLVDQRVVRWQNRAHFFAIAAQLMRRVLVDYARKRQYAKRGGGAQQVSLDETALISQERAADFVALDDALKELTAVDARQSMIVELRFFGGLSVEETAEAVGISPATVKREWSAAKAWLYHRMSKQ